MLSLSVAILSPLLPKGYILQWLFIPTFDLNCLPMMNYDIKRTGKMEGNKAGTAIDDSSSRTVEEVHKVTRTGVQEIMKAVKS